VPALGICVVLSPEGSESGADELVFDVIGHPRGFIADPRFGRHIHPSQTESLEVIEGEIEVEFGGQRRHLRAGSAIEIPAGAAHLQLPSGTEAGHVRVRVRPAGRTEAYLRRLAELSQRGEFDRAGRPHLIAGAHMLLDFCDVGYPTFAPLPVQRAAARAVLAGAEAATATVRSLAATGARIWRPYEFVDEWEVSAPPRAVYDVLLDGRTYPQWWRRVYIDVQSDGSRTVGSVAHQHFKGFLPYHLNTTSRIVRLDPGRMIAAEIDGDLRGTGVWTLTPTQRGCAVRFDWTVHADRLLLRLLTPVLRPALRANHSWSIARAVEGLEPYVLARSPTPASEAPTPG
jgi:uncharacterized protein YndB with AHSA1/START domain